MKKSSAFLDKHLAQTTMFPFGLKVKRAEGIYIYTTDGKRYMDMISGVGVSALGHGQPEIKKAIHDQVEKHMHVMVYGEFLQSAQNELASELCDSLPSKLNTVYLVNSGTEGIEAALKLAKRVTGRTELIGCKGSYHGSTHGSMSVSANLNKKLAYLPLLPDIQFIGFNDLGDLEKISSRTAAVIAETIQGDAGVRIPDIEWMKALRQKCDDTGALLILDEIQAGLGRAGTLFAFEQFGIEPDILVLGKALGGGFPIGALVANRAHMSQFTENPMLGHITTFGGHPVVCAAANAALKILKRNNILSEVEQKGQRIRQKLESHQKVQAVRQRGLFIAVDLESQEQTQQMVDYCLENGLIGFWFLSVPNSFRLAPPLVITNEEIDEALQIIIQGLNNLS